MFVRLQVMFLQAFRREDGQALSEYALVLAWIAIIATVALKFISGKVAAVLNSTANSL